MAYIGKQPAIGNFVKLDAISVVNGQASYTMQNGGANFTEYNNVNQFLVSLNGILQSPTDSFTVSGSTITFASNLVTGDIIDFIIVLGNSLDVGVPSDNTVSLAKLTATGTKDATTFLRGDNSFQEVPAGGITMADQWRLTADRSTNETSSTDVSANLERNDNSGFGYIGSGMTESSGVFTFPETGTYFIQTVASWLMSSSSTYNVLMIFTTNDNSSYTQQTETHVPAFGAHFESGTNTFIFNCTNTSTHKVKFRVAVQSGTQTLRGNSTKTETHFNFIRLGDST
jgi:hypothetical protein